MKNYLKLLPYLRPYIGLLAWAAAGMVASSLLKGVSLSMLVPLVDLILLGRSVELPAWVPAWAAGALQAFGALSPLVKLHLLAAAVALLFLLKNAILFFQTYWMNDVALRFLRDIRNALYAHYQRLSHSFFSGERTGELVSRITYDVSVLQNTITEGFSDLIYSSAQVLVLVGILVAIHWKLALAALVLLPLLGLPVVRIGKALRKLGLLVQERMADLNSRLIENLQGMRIVKAFTAEAEQLRRFSEINQGYYKANIKTVKRREALAAITDLFGMLGGLAVMEVGGRAVLEGQISPGTVILFLAALLSLYQPVKKLSRLHSVNQQALSAAKRVVEILRTEPGVQEAPGASELARFSRQIRFEDVWFTYLPGRNLARLPGGPSVSEADGEGEPRFVVRGVDLSVQAGEVVALVGASGAGKTTLVNLLLRFYDPVRGRITWDGTDIRSVTLSSLRKQIGLVTQEPFLFHDSVRANIAFSRPQASMEEVAQAARAANADGFIARLPAGYDTLVGDLGGKLSGGERQRIAMARALLKDPPILILDEATSQLDSESEALVQEALERLMAGRTVFVIAHRLSTIRRADRIVVLDEGRVAEVGRHEELMRGSALYRRLYELQLT